MEKQLPRGLRNKNPLNIEFSQKQTWQGQITEGRKDSRFCEFTHIELGLRAGFFIIRKYMAKPPLGYGRNTIDKIIRRWAPPTENNTDRYVSFVEAKVGISRHQRLKFEQKHLICSIVSAMCEMECGQHVSYQYVENAYARSLR